MGDQNHCGMDATTESAEIRTLDSNVIYRVVSNRLYMRMGDYKLVDIDKFNVVLSYLDGPDNYTVPMPRCTLQDAIQYGMITVIKGET